MMRPTEPENASDSLASYEFKSAGKQLSTEPNRIGYLTPSSASEPIDELLRRYQRDGYLYLKGLLDRDAVQNFRASVFERLSPSGLLQTGSRPVDGLVTHEDFDKAIAGQNIMEIVRSADFEDFCKQPRMLKFVEAFLGGAAHLHKRKIMRVTYPGSGITTPAHYDRVYLRGGTENLITIWLPIGDVSLEEGGLIYLEKSHVFGRKMEKDFNQRAVNLPEDERVSAFNTLMNKGGQVSDDLPSLAEQFDARWLMTSFEAGDALLHDPYLIHASTENTHTGGRMRLSTDIRFQRSDDTIDQRWGNHWHYDDDL